MAYNSEILCDSISPAGVRLTTFRVTYPRFSHADFLRHRLLSRCVSSSRAIPIQTFMRQVHEDPALPQFWGRNQKGMQAFEELTGWRQVVAEGMIRVARYGALGLAAGLSALGLHKQNVNRYLEPWQYVTEVITATEWDNLWFLRNHADAQPELRRIVAWMRRDYELSEPTALRVGQWHLPFIMSQDTWHVATSGSRIVTRPLDELCRISAARCARTSYNTRGGKMDAKADLALFTRLAERPEGEPLHMSPLEHQATPIDNTEAHKMWSGNLRGWVQYRKTYERERVGYAPGEAGSRLARDVL